MLSSSGEDLCILMILCLARGPERHDVCGATFTGEQCTLERTNVMPIMAETPVTIYGSEPHS